MDPVRNPFAPGAGSPPPELVGRDDLLESFRVAGARLQIGRSVKSTLMVGLRGVGKTVLLDRMRELGEEERLHCVRIEAPEGRSLPAILAPQLRVALLRLSLHERARQSATRALSALSGFVRGLKFRYADIEVAVDHEPTPGVADSGDLESDLQDLLDAVGQAASDAQSGVVLFVDELQYVAENELAALIVALHRASQRRLPVMLVGAGLPQLRGHMGRAKSYAERLFEFPAIGPLEPVDARRALVAPTDEEGVRWSEAALDVVLATTHGYPYFLQEWGKHAWDVATGPDEIVKRDVVAASALALAALDASFFRVRFDRLAPSEKTYLRAMASLGPGPHRSGDIAEGLARDVRSLAPTRAKLIDKGMIYSPSHGDTDFTVPLFDGFMRRIMPN